MIRKVWKDFQVYSYIQSGSILLGLQTGGLCRQVASADRWPPQTGGLRRQVASADRWPPQTGGLRKKSATFPYRNFDILFSSCPPLSLSLLLVLLQLWPEQLHPRLSLTCHKKQQKWRKPQLRAKFPFSASVILPISQLSLSFDVLSELWFSQKRAHLLSETMWEYCFRVRDASNPKTKTEGQKWMTSQLEHPCLVFFSLENK